MTDKEKAKEESEANLQELSREIWTLTTKLLDVLQSQTDSLEDKNVALEYLAPIHAQVDNAACQLSKTISRFKYPKHFADCWKCVDAGTATGCSECGKIKLVA